MATIAIPGQNQEEDKDQGVLNTQTGGGPAMGSGMAAQQSQGAAPQQRRKGSGRFTNLQKYLQANQAGGQRVASGIGQNIQGDIDQQRDRTQSYLGDIRQGIQQAQDTAQQGSQFLGQLRGIGQNIQAGTGAEQFNQRPQDFGIQQFTQSPQFGQFQNIQAGRGIDEDLLRTQQSNLTGAAQQYLGQSQEAMQRLGTEGGRFGLLKETFGGASAPQYSTGQQRLDQLFLARQGLQPLQEQVRADVTGAQDILRQAAQTGADVGSVRAQEQQLMQDIGQQASANEQAYVDMLSSYVPEINRQRQAEFQALEDALSTYRKPAAGQVGATVLRPGLTGEQLQRLGVNREYGAFDVLENLAGASDVATRGRDAQTYRDVANQADVDRYASLAQIAGIAPDRISEAVDLGAAWTAREGDANLANRLQAAQRQFDQLARDTTIQRVEQGRRGRDIFGRRAAVYGGATASAADLLNRGIDAFQLFEGGKTKGGWGRARAERSRDRAWQDFKNFLNEQNYARTIGAPQTGKGGLNAPTMGYGTRATPGGLGASSPVPVGTTVKLGAPGFEKRFK